VKILKGEFKIHEKTSENVADLLKRLLLITPQYRMRVCDVILLFLNILYKILEHKWLK